MSLLKFSFKSSQGWHPLPRWAKTCFDIGFAVGSHIDEYSRLVVGLVVPTRIYAAALIAAGFVTSRVDEIDVEQHFQTLSSLDEGTPVYWARDGHLIPAIFSGADVVNGKPCIWLQTATGGNLREIVWKEQSQNVHHAPTRFRLTRESKRIPLNLNQAFLRKLIGYIDLYQFAIQTDYTCAIWGQRARLHAEITQTLFAHGAPSDGAIGTLQDILRVRSFQQAREPFRTDVLPLGAVDQFIDSPPKVVIFDGARSYVRNREYCNDIHQIVVLDRTEGIVFKQAADEFNTDYFNRSDTVDIAITELPPAMELVAFQEGSHAR